MRRARNITASAVVLSTAVWAVTCIRCSGEPSSGGPGGQLGDSGADSGEGAGDSAADAVDTGLTGWLPIEPLGEDGEYFPVVPAGLGVNCGPGCRVVIPVQVEHPGYFTYSFDNDHIVDTDMHQIYHLDLATGLVRVVARAESESYFVQAHVHGQYVSYYRDRPEGWQVEVIDLAQKRRRVVATANKNTSIVHTAVNQNYAFWVDNSLWAADLETGEQRRLTSAIIDCDRHCTTDTGFLCSTTGDIASVDAVTGADTAIAPTNALQTDGVCSPDKTRFVWVDYRDPPGPVSTYDGDRTAGEVYFQDFTTNELVRVSHDSANTPVAKSFPAIEGDTVVWDEELSTEDQNPGSAQFVYAGPRALVWFDLKTKKRCKTDSINLGKLAVIRGKVYSIFVNSAGGGGVWLVEVDLHSPDIPWTCTP